MERGTTTHNLFFLLLLVHGSKQEDPAGACTFQLKGTARDQHPAPIEVRQEHSFTSCGIACRMNVQCQYFALLGQTCVLTGTDDWKEHTDGKWSIYRKVFIFTRSQLSRP